MQDKLCIVLSSEYPANNPVWNDEVQRDLTTVKETLTDHDCIEITLPVIAGRLFTKKLVKAALDAIGVHYTTCHIVLNTHGIPGSSDLKHEIVKLVVENLSEKNIVISQISALLCDGMVAQPHEEILTSHTYRVHRKEASMRILQDRLNSMNTPITQNFEIRGFSSAYLPDRDQTEVVDILNGHGGVTLSVSTKPYHTLSPALYATQILESIQVIDQYKATDHPQSFPAYVRATNLLGLVLTDMQKNVLAHLQSNQPLADEFQPLLEAVEVYCRATHRLTEPLDANNFEFMFKHWLKNHKIYSNERITMLEKHVTIFLTSHDSEKLIQKKSRYLSPHVTKALFPPASLQLAADSKVDESNFSSETDDKTFKK
ncbi:MAG: hypothetical protein KBB94_00930 [Legionellaceae bacterium]|nr:hypothetical protein [Legionellaceae bacterium]MBP9774280.1 hypothetical protein [Legionellaceae bacterium]